MHISRGLRTNPFTPFALRELTFVWQLFVRAVLVSPDHQLNRKMDFWSTTKAVCSVIVHTHRVSLYLLRAVEFGGGLSGCQIRWSSFLLLSGWVRKGKGCYPWEGGPFFLLGGGGSTPLRLSFQGARAYRIRPDPLTALRLF